MKNLRLILTKLKATGFTVNLQKFSFIEPDVKYVGHIINENGLHKDPVKVKAIVGLGQMTALKLKRLWEWYIITRILFLMFQLF